MRGSVNQITQHPKDRDQGPAKNQKKIRVLQTTKIWAAGEKATKNHNPETPAYYSHQIADCFVV